MRVLFFLVAATLLLQATPAQGNFFSPWKFFGKNAGSSSCKTVTPQKGVSLTNYISARWYIHQQMATQAGNPDGRWNFCVYAEYTLTQPKLLAVHNYANVDGVNKNPREANLCAAIPDPVNDPGRLAVGPCFLPQFFYGPYFIVAYDEAEGYALISGGSPTVPTKNGLCTTGTGFNNAGLWIFTRSNVRNEALIQKVRGIAREKGFDPDLLQDVTHVGCTYQAPKAPSALRG